MAESTRERIERLIRAARADERTKKLPELIQKEIDEHVRLAWEAVTPIFEPDPKPLRMTLDQLRDQVVLGLAGLGIQHELATNPHEREAISAFSRAFTTLGLSYARQIRATDELQATLDALATAKLEGRA